MIWTLKMTLAAVIGGDFLLFFLLITIWAALHARRRRRENAEIRKALTHFPPDEAVKRAKEEQETADAWRRMQHYSAADAYGGDSG